MIFSPAALAEEKFKRKRGIKKKYPTIFNNKYPTIFLLVKDQHFLENDFFPGDVSVQGQWKIYFSFEFQSGPSPLVGVVFILQLL